ncbi:DUF2066 domain-containing protein [Reyranella sp.]|uniref:DUF2066 domain-containing protein n=1 Tax=Reyranella sp. TaxID=1929291 RepID=UPI003BA8492A
MPPARRFSTRWFFLAAAFVAASLSFAGGVSAQENSNYTVTGVDVDVTGSDPLQARQIGLAEGRRKAAQMLVDRLVAPQDRARVSIPSDANLEGMVRGIEFVRERPAPGRYSATLNVVFQPDQVKAWLGGSGARVSETVPRAALVVPLWKDQSGVEPLDERNPWREAWRGLDTTGSAVPVTVVRGDRADQGAVTAEQLYIGDVSALARLNARYNAPTIVVAVVDGPREGGPLTVKGLRYDTQTGARSEIPAATVADAAKLPDAARQMHARLDEQWREVAVVRRDAQDSIDVTVPIRTLADWVQIRQRLGGLPALRNVAVRNLEADRAELRLDYFGTTEDLQRVLAQAGLSLDREGDKWRLQAR